MQISKSNDCTQLHTKLCRFLRINRVNYFKALLSLLNEFKMFIGLDIK